MDERHYKREKLRGISLEKIKVMICKVSYSNRTVLSVMSHFSITDLRKLLVFFFFWLIFSKPILSNR